jgi:hypothetical protein
MTLLQRGPVGVEPRGFSSSNSYRKEERGERREERGERREERGKVKDCDAERV